ncbi:MAG: polymer-forming cytoskeletal protein [Lachnospiraceae bacterium]|jgi:cytoskeletal protein CcmA (bactofilin family)|nr:polymer-forming cytoskeletal protein [Lachnospiraceae bacterium]
MSFFKDFKEDLSQAVNELLPGEELQGNTLQKQPDLVVNTLEQEVDVESELKKLEGLFDKVDKSVQEEKPIIMTPPKPQETKLEDAIQKNQSAVKIEAERAKQKEDTIVSTENEVKSENVSSLSGEVSEEVTVVTEGTSLKGDMESIGSFELRGKVEGNVICNGKMTVTGSIKGNTKSSEFFADAAKIEGEISTTGTVKIGLGSVVIGNITASSAVIAGAIKGDIDVQGPVVVDTSAVVMGNIKSRSVQINNGAVIEGFCSQCYAEVDMDSLFVEK